MIHNSVHYNHHKIDILNSCYFYSCIIVIFVLKLCTGYIQLLHDFVKHWIICFVEKIMLIILLLKFDPKLVLLLHSSSESSELSESFESDESLESSVLVLRILMLICLVLTILVSLIRSLV
jgi:hypothetical protein